jgi:4-alpha-glucanotransferase
MRAAGTLLHPTSLPGAFGIGDLGPQAEAFLDWAASAGQSIWQVLPIGPTGHGHSPYACHSVFAGNPLLISPERLCADGLLDAAALNDAPAGAEERVDFAAAIGWKEGILRSAWERFRRWPAREHAADLEAFSNHPDHVAWLSDWCLYSALKARRGGHSWTEWEEGLRRRDPEALAAASRELKQEIAYHRFLQFQFFRQWSRIMEEAHRRGLLLLGDIPIYAALDSADVWANARLFTVDRDGAPERVAGVPPDYFSETGQLWGNPLYRWERLEEEGFAWWIARVRACLRAADLLRLDHFRGFVGYWSVPAGAPTAIGGEWVSGPGAKLFDALRSALGRLPFVAEDLGVITPDVTALRRALGLPGMRVLQFAFDEEQSPHLPDRCGPDTALYTGTHDNDTAAGWYRTLGEESRRRAASVLGGSESTVAWDMIRAAYESGAGIAIAPAQDILELGSEARMNTPGRRDGNWAWRARPGAFTPRLAARLHDLAARTGRLPAGSGIS